MAWVLAQQPTFQAMAVMRALDEKQQASVGSVSKDRLRYEKYLLTADGPPFRRSLPCVIGLTTPSFFLGIGRDRLEGGSPDGTCTV